MDKRKSIFRRDLFEIENARNMTRDELVNTFVPTKSFWRLLTAKNHMVLGSRGSGKTALAKMLSHDHLSKYEHDRAKLAVNTKAFIGIYVPTSIEWVGGLKNKPWQTEAEAERFFQWRLNLSTCLSFLVCLRSCLNTYVSDKYNKSILESVIISEISYIWSDREERFDTIRKLQEYLEDVEHDKHLQLTKYRVLGHIDSNEKMVGIYFETTLFNPLKKGISIASRCLKLPKETTWALCIDEAEFLSNMHQRILNSHMRTDSGNLVFKITTMPYFHHTLDTNTNSPLNEGHDFEYVYIDRDPVLLDIGGRMGERDKFARTLFNKRMEVSGYKYKFRKVTLQDLLGKSILIDRRSGIWEKNGKLWKLLLRHGNENVIKRALKLKSNEKAFGDQIARKLTGALILKDEVSNLKGRKELGVFSGSSIIIRCGDANPRRLIRIFNSLLLKASWKYDNKNVKIGVKQLSQKEQNRILTEFSLSTLTRIQSETEFGPDLYEFISSIGNYMGYRLHHEKIGSDQYSSVSINRQNCDLHWKLIQRAVALGMLYPNISANNPDQMPVRSGIFHLAYILAPHFRIMPRRGRSISLKTAFNAPCNIKDMGKQLQLPFSDMKD